mmetsp:Transcript_57395/g.136630  ORF Transcript_57395/g.136630 Transcript_57395/m.136630 type:complete len:213 (+) Transcript_57395:724-1362(+)
MSVPAWIIFGIISSLQEAGPNDATTLVFLLLWSVSCLLSPMPQLSILGGRNGILLLMATKGQACCKRCFTVSASRVADASAKTASQGYLPLAASPDSITASVPSQTALQRSDTSARVGTGASIMLSTIWVAVMTKSPASLALRISNFWAKGTRFSPSSTPRSPLATISACDLAMMPSMLVKAWGFSILGQIFGRFSAGTLRRSMMSMSSCRS